MKKLCLLIVMVTASVSINAQHVDAGLKAGLNLAQMRFTFDGDSHTTDMAVGFQAGAYFSFGVSDFFFIQPEVIFNRVGGKENQFDENDEEVSLKYKLDYMSIPVIFKFKVAENFNLQVGPQVGFLTAANAKIERPGESGEVSVKDLFKTVDLGANVGFGLTFDRLGFDARYQLGMINIIKGSSSTIIFNDDVNAFNRVIQFTVSYRLTSN